MMDGIRAELVWFAEEMEKKLRENDHKGGWDGCDPWGLIVRTYEELGELCDAYTSGEDPDTVIREAADVANFAMMVADIVRKRSEVAAHSEG